MESITGIILCGGKSSRFGSDKGLHLFAGRPLVLHAYDILKPVCSEILLSSNNPEYKKFDVGYIPDLTENAGPLAGIVSAMKYASNIKCCVLACDLPFIPTGLFDFLINRMGTSEAIVPVHESFTEPLAAVYSSKALSVLESCLKHKVFKMIDVLTFLKVLYIEVSREHFYQKQIFTNINRMEDFENIPGQSSLSDNDP